MTNKSHTCWRELFWGGKKSLRVLNTIFWWLCLMVFSSSTFLVKVWSLRKRDVYIFVTVKCVQYTYICDLNLIKCSAFNSSFFSARNSLFRSFCLLWPQSCLLRSELGFHRLICDITWWNILHTRPFRVITSPVLHVLKERQVPVPLGFVLSSLRTRLKTACGRDN